MNKHVFKGHRTLLGSKYVTYGELELPTRYDIFQKSNNGFDWGNDNDGSTQLSFSMLYQLSNKETATENVEKFRNEIIKTLNSRDWVLSAVDILAWIERNSQQSSKKEQPSKMKKLKPAKKSKKTNVVKEICQELNITQKQLAEILEVPEGTVSSWAVKNEIPRLGKKAIEFYMLSAKNQKIVDSYRSFMQLLDAS